MNQHADVPRDMLAPLISLRLAVELISVFSLVRLVLLVAAVASEANSNLLRQTSRSIRMHAQSPGPPIAGRLWPFVLELSFNMVAAQWAAALP